MREQQAAQRRQTAIERAIRELERRFGPGIVYRLSQARPKVDAIALPTGSLGLDRAIGIGGVPRGRITQLLGPPSCGKTTIAYHILANAQVDGGLAAFIDAVQTMDGDAMLATGVNLDDLLIAVPASAAEALEIAEILARCRALDAVVLANPAGLRAAGSLHEGDLNFIGKRSTYEALRKLNASLKGSPTAMVFVEEELTFTTTLVSFQASLRVIFSSLRALRGPGGDIVGLRARALVTKNKLARPGGFAEFIVRESGGIYREAELLDLALSHSLVETLPLGLAYQGELLGKSRAGALAYLTRTPALATKMAAHLQEYFQSCKAYPGTTRPARKTALEAKRSGADGGSGQEASPRAADHLRGLPPDP